MQAFSTGGRYNLLKRNLAVAELFTQIAGVNFMKNEELMMEFVLGDSDLLQWKVRSKCLSCKANSFIFARRGQKETIVLL